MAGSLTYRNYTADDGQSYAVRVDESNSNATVSGGTGALLPLRTANVPPIPKTLKMRYFLARDTVNPNLKRKFFCGTSANAIAGLAVGSTITAEDYPGEGGGAGSARTFTITAYRGEKRNIIPGIAATDTGLTDGTASQ